MILTCPECSARFAVPDALIPPEGRMVKCGRCHHPWQVVLPPTEEPEENVPHSLAETLQEVAAHEALHAHDSNPSSADEGHEAEGMTNPRSLPVLVPETPKTTLLLLRVAAASIACVWLVIAAYSYYPHWQHLPVLKLLYQWAGTQPTDGLVFEEGQMVRNRLEGGGKTQFLLTGSVANRSAEPRLLPRVRVQLLDAKNTVLWSHNYDVEETMAAGASYPFRIENITTTHGDKVATMRVDLGNSLQLRMR